VEQFNVTENILLGRELKKFSALGMIDWACMVDVTRELLAEFELPPDLAQEPVGNLSDEQRQVVMLLRTLYRSCRLLLLDDIIPILSFQRQKILLGKIKKLASQGTSIIISSDDLKHLFTVTDRIIVLYEGRLVADRRTAESTPREIVELIVGSSGQEQVSPLIWALESYHSAQQQSEQLRRTQASLKESLEARNSQNRQLVERLGDQLDLVLRRDLQNDRQHVFDDVGRVVLEATGEDFDEPHGFTNNTPVPARPRQPSRPPDFEQPARARRPS
jgi:ABC-type sugar transport system ATPase subunit